jgi:hypothetical protein
LADIFTAMNRVTWPDRFDLSGSMQSLLRAQSTYLLPTIEVARGKLGKRQTAARLSVKDCLHIASDRLSGLNSLRQDLGIEYALAIEWAETALE